MTSIEKAIRKKYDLSLPAMRVLKLLYALKDRPNCCISFKYIKSLCKIARTYEVADILYNLSLQKLIDVKLIASGWITHVKLSDELVKDLEQ